MARSLADTERDVMRDARDRSLSELAAVLAAKVTPDATIRAIVERDASLLDRATKADLEGRMLALIAECRYTVEIVSRDYTNVCGGEEIITGETIARCADAGFALERIRERMQTLAWGEDIELSVTREHDNAPREGRRA